MGGTENILGSHRGYRVAVNGHSHRRKGNYWSRSSAARPLKEGHKLVISAEDDGILFLGLVHFEGGGGGHQKKPEVKRNGSRNIKILDLGQTKCYFCQIFVIYLC